MGGTEQRSQDQEMLQVEERGGAVFEIPISRGFSCHMILPKHPLQLAPTSAPLLPTCRARRQLRPQVGGPHGEAQEREEEFWGIASGRGRGTGASWEPTDWSGMGWRHDRFMLPCLCGILAALSQR